MHTIDFSPILRHTVGFDRMQRLMNSAMQQDNAANTYLPYNIEQTGENDYSVTLALAGFGEEDDNELSGVPCRGGAESDDPQALQNTVPWTWILVVAALSGMNPSRQNPAPVLAGYCHPGWLHWPQE